MPTRYRCGACGNLTRFDVIESRRSKLFYHYTLGGDLNVESTEDLERQVERVICRWCQSSSAIETIEEEAAGTDERAGSDAGRV